MSFREWQSVISLAVSALVVAWLAFDLASGGTGGSVAEVAMRLVWAIVAMILLNIVAAIAFVILVSIVQRQEWKDEKADERDRAVEARSMRNAYFVASGGGALTLLALAFGVAPSFGAYALFAALLAGGLTESISRLVYYRIG